MSSSPFTTSGRSDGTGRWAHLSGGEAAFLSSHIEPASRVRGPAETMLAAKPAATVRAGPPRTQTSVTLTRPYTTLRTACRRTLGQCGSSFTPLARERSTAAAGHRGQRREGLRRDRDGEHRRCRSSVDRAVRCVPSAEDPMGRRGPGGPADRLRRWSRRWRRASRPGERGRTTPRGIGAALVEHVCGWAITRADTVTLTTFHDVEWNGPLHAR